VADAPWLALLARVGLLASEKNRLLCEFAQAAGRSRCALKALPALSKVVAKISHKETCPTQWFNASTIRH